MYILWNSKSLHPCVTSSNNFTRCKFKIGLLCIQKFLILVRSSYWYGRYEKDPSRWSETQVSITSTSPDFVQSQDFSVFRFLSGTRIQSERGMDKIPKIMKIWKKLKKKENFRILIFLISIFQIFRFFEFTSFHFLEESGEVPMVDIPGRKRKSPKNGQDNRNQRK